MGRLGPQDYDWFDGRGLPSLWLATSALGAPQEEKKASFPSFRRRSTASNTVLIQDGVIGPVTHAVIRVGGRTYARSLPPRTPPVDLDWEAWQGPARRHPYPPTRQKQLACFLRIWPGALTGWGVHDVRAGDRQAAAAPGQKLL